MSQKPNITFETTSQFLKEKYPSGISQLVQLSGGEWSQAYSFVHNESKFVLRWCHSDESFAKDRFAAQFASNDLPIPVLVASGKEFGTFYAISVYSPGLFIETLSEPELESTLPALYALFDALRTTDLSHTSGYGMWDRAGQGSHTSWKEYLLDVAKDISGSMTHGWREHLCKQSALEGIFSELHVLLEKHIEACPEVRELVHSDLLNFNVLVKDRKISGVIDWQCSLYGDSLYDIAWFLYYAPWYPQFGTIGLSEKILTHYQKSTSNSENISKRLCCYYLHIGLGSIAYNAFKQDYSAAQDAADYTMKIINFN